MTVPNIYFPHLKLAFCIDPVAFQIFGISIYWYGIIMAAAILGGSVTACYFGKKEGISEEAIFDYILLAMPCAVIGARLYYVIFHWQYYRENPGEIIHIRQGGIAIYGAVIAAVLVAWFYTQKKQLSFFRFADIAVLGLLLGQAIGRYGNFVNKEAFGKGTDSFFAMAIAKNEAKGPFTQSVLSHQVTFPQFGSQLYLQVHPTFLYESCWNIVLFIGLIFYRKYRKFEGELFFIYLIGYGVGRFWIEGLRTDQLIIWGTHVPVSQVVAAISIIMGIIGIIVCRMEKEGRKS